MPLVAEAVGVRVQVLLIPGEVSREMRGELVEFIAAENTQSVMDA